MPYKLRKAPEEDKYWVETEATGKKHSKKPLSKNMATRQMRALYVHGSGNEQSSARVPAPVAARPPPPPPPKAKRIPGARKYTEAPYPGMVPQVPATTVSPSSMNFYGLDRGFAPGPLEIGATKWFNRAQRVVNKPTHVPPTWRQSELLEYAPPHWELSGMTPEPYRILHRFVAPDYMNIHENPPERERTIGDEEHPPAFTAVGEGKPRWARMRRNVQPLHNEDYWGNSRLDLTGNPLRPHQHFSSLYSPESVLTQFR